MKGFSMRLPSLIFALTLPFAATAAPVDYALQAEQSTVGFTYYFNGSAATGTMPVVDADLVIDFARVGNSQIDVTLAPSRARTAFPLAADALKSASVLNTQAHPEIHFMSTHVTGGGATANITGNLTIRGVTRQVTLAAQLYRQRGTASDDLSQLSIVLTGAINRSDFGAVGYGDLVDDTVELKILARIQQES